ncbi:hypothetical protein LTR78_004755 [Recurvomyces mirabilis]|uniref:RNase III domain-containing protein n=1 Tax=Recurvomyces mirabilis TaxID=574656 RepID=A0AAE1C252_9PEZI|nr:hypothetical protein LTR78_004755 [Recurvomyces mirabilis]KAK5157926.1 hypothetical protein LTS14_003849 [Recurvomyces mirabilis]
MTAKLAEAKALLARIMDYHFVNDDRLLEAIDTTGMRKPQSNQRLALLGDVVLKHVLLDDWYPTGTPKGTGNSIVSTVGSNASLAAAAHNVGLASCIITNPGHMGAVSNGMLATAVEAILGAIYLDSGKSVDSVKDAMTAFGLVSGSEG